MMKIRTIVTVILFSTLFFFNACKPESSEEILNVKAPSQIISVEQAVEMKKTYQDTIGNLIKLNNSTPEEEYDPTLFAFIELDSLKQYIAYLEEVERLNDKKISGIRVYFAAYPSTSKSNNKEPLYKSRETFFFAPTMEVAPNEWGREYPNLRNIPFYIEPTGKNRIIGNFKAIDGLLCKKDSRTSGTKSNDSEKTSLILNEMQLTPPPK
ncbi:hypothetical protein [uncultured Flavobacterium sp.]|uniref:hypothetical protein n=1 Tax=uncultured Flavobacterium sp. TaxID=165435 RepID=UPI0030C7A5D1